MHKWRGDNYCHHLRPCLVFWVEIALKKICCYIWCKVNITNAVKAPLCFICKMAILLLLSLINNIRSSFFLSPISSICVRVSSVATLEKNRVCSYYPANCISWKYIDKKPSTKITNVLTLCQRSSLRDHTEIDKKG